MSESPEAMWTDAFGEAMKGEPARPRDQAAEAERLVEEAEAIEAEDLVADFECLRDEAGRGLDVAGKLREAKDEFERRKANAREFNSRLEFEVWIYKMVRGGFGLRRENIGTTPAARPTAIPACHSWYVRPVGDVSDPESLRAIAAEVERLRVEGLDLCGAKITDADLAHLGALTGLRVLRLPRQITDAGLAHLKG
ncbi:MAG: hypothetical protein ACYSU0_12045, partial [Planctomycetota bacterium]